MCKFCENIGQEFTKLCTALPKKAMLFIHCQEEFISWGDEILNQLDQVLAGELFEQLSVKAVGVFWKEMTSITFQVLYAMAAVEAHLDTAMVA